MAKKKPAVTGDVVNKIDVQGLGRAHELVQEAMDLVVKAREKDHRSEVLAALNGLKKANEWLGKSKPEEPEEEPEQGQE